MINIKQIRKELGLTQRELANELGLAKNGDVYIRKVENGKAEPSGLLVRAIEMLLKVRGQTSDRMIKLNDMKKSIIDPQKISYMSIDDEEQLKIIIENNFSKISELERKISNLHKEIGLRNTKIAGLRKENDFLKKIAVKQGKCKMNA